MVLTPYPIAFGFIGWSPRHKNQRNMQFLSYRVPSDILMLQIDLSRSNYLDNVWKSFPSAQQCEPTLEFRFPELTGSIPAMYPEPSSTRARNCATTSYSNFSSLPHTDSTGSTSFPKIFNIGKASANLPRFRNHIPTPRNCSGTPPNRASSYGSFFASSKRPAGATP